MRGAPSLSCSRTPRARPPAGCAGGLPRNGIDGPPHNRRSIATPAGLGILVLALATLLASETLAAADPAASDTGHAATAAAWRGASPTPAGTSDGPGWPPGLRLDSLLRTDALPALSSIVLVDDRQHEAWSATASQRIAAALEGARRGRNGLDTTVLDTHWTLRRTLTLGAGFVYSAASDNLDHSARIVRLTYRPPGLAWLDAQLRLRRADGHLPGAGTTHSQRLQQHELLLQATSRPLGERWTLSLQAGGGGQWIDGGAAAPIFSVEARALGELGRRVDLQSRLACTNAADLDAGPATRTFRHCLASVSLLLDW
jgi:hypothetical protein